MTKTIILNRFFVKNDPLFIECCNLASITPSIRQASKYRRKLGKAYKFITKARKSLKKDKEEQVDL